jgi:hypothetical protein
MTEPDFVPEADRAEQEELVDPPGVALATEASPPSGDVPEADALEQQLDALPGPPEGPRGPVGDREANDADVVEQETGVRGDEEDDLLS